MEKTGSGKVMTPIGAFHLYPMVNFSTGKRRISVSIYGPRDEFDGVPVYIDGSITFDPGTLTNFRNVLTLTWFDSDRVTIGSFHIEGGVNPIGWQTKSKESSFRPSEDPALIEKGNRLAATIMEKAPLLFETLEPVAIELIIDALTVEDEKINSVSRDIQNLIVSAKLLVPTALREPVYEINPAPDN